VQALKQDGAVNESPNPFSTQVQMFVHPLFQALRERTPASGPSLWNSTGRQRLSSCSRLEFWKCATIAFLP